MKLIISIVLCAAILCSVMIMSGIVSSAQTSHEQFSLSTTDLVKEMGAGWNLGNTFEATDRWDSGWSDSFTVNDVETGWGNPTTTQAIFDKVADQGFKSVRIPVSWYRWVDDDNGYKIDSAWMSRVKEIVSYAYAHDMYVIVNMHHDDKDWLDISKTGDEWEAVKEKYQAIWVQIAAEFKDYDEHLLLEGGNEMVADGDWWGHSQYYFDNQNELYQIFVDTVRSSGGNNAKRYLVLPTYGAQWYSHQWGNLVIPNGDSHCIIDIHWYRTNTSEYDTYMSAIDNGLVS